MNSFTALCSKVSAHPHLFSSAEKFLITMMKKAWAQVEAIGGVYDVSNYKILHDGMATCADDAWLTYLAHYASFNEAELAKLRAL